MRRPLIRLLLTGQCAYDQAVLAAHLGIINSPDTWAATLEFLT